MDLSKYWQNLARELLRQQENGEIRYHTEGDPCAAEWIGRASALLEEVLRTSEERA